MTTIREHLDALGYSSGDHDRDVREALLELRHARVSLSAFRKEREDEDRDIGDGQIIVSYDAWMDSQRRAALGSIPPHYPARTIE